MPPVPPEDREDQGIDEDPLAGAVNEHPGLAHLDVKLAHKPGEYIVGHLVSRSLLTRTLQAYHCAKTALVLAVELGIPLLPRLIAQFISKQLHPNSMNLHCRLLPYTGRIKIFNSATATFVSPSDPSGIGGMRHETICALPSWHQGPAWYNCVYVSTDDTNNGMLGMDITCVYCFLSFTHTNGQIFLCTLVHWFDCVTDEPDELTGMWMVSPSFLEDGSHNLAVIHVDSIICAAHLLPIFEDELVPPYISFHNSLSIYRGFYVNHFADHHAFELAIWFLWVLVQDWCDRFCISSEAK